HPVVEELRTVRTQLLIRWFNPAAGRRTLVVASPGAREGRSFIAANLAVSFSQLGQRTLLIDADFRAPRQQGIFNIADRFGLSSVLSGRADLSVAAPVAGITGLAVLPAGPVPPNPLELLSRGSFAALLGRAQAEYDVILIDTPPASEYADAQSVAFGVGVAIGELDAMVAALTVLACFATLADYRIGAVLLVIMLPVEGSYLFPHSVFGFTGLNPINMVLAATLISYLLRGYEVRRFLPKPLVWLCVL